MGPVLCLIVERAQHAAEAPGMQVPREASMPGDEIPRRAGVTCHLRDRRRWKVTRALGGAGLPLAAHRTQPFMAGNHQAYRRGASGTSLNRRRSASMLKFRSDDLARSREWRRAGPVRVIS